ncbi:MAG: non-homologous end-joining DNA ligase [bacterium]
MARKTLSEYERKRSFDRTPEPEGEIGDAGETGGGRFVIQEHHATRLHWDLRLERDGVAVSWALPRGIPPHPKENRLAVRTEDHPLEYLEFEGRIPAGQYGAGTMTIWDRGSYSAEKFRDDKVIVSLHGERVRGTYALFPTKGDNWMIHRMDPPTDPDRVPMPEGGIRPMTATLSKRLPRDEEGWAFELKWDGVRAIAYCEAGHFRLESRNLREITSQYPEVRPIAASLGARQTILDGEIVAFSEDGTPDFQALQGRMHLGSEAAVRRRAKETPVTYVIFDLLFCEGHDLCGLPYSERRQRLQALGLDGPSWQTPAARPRDGRALLKLTADRGLEGVVAKRTESRYLPGRRSSSWLKVKNVESQDFVIGGWMPGEGSRSQTLGALLAGYYEEADGELCLRYAGRVGTGFREDTLRRLSGLLGKLETAESPFAGRQPPKQARFAEPRLVAEVEFRQWTAARTLRAPSFKGLRDDRDPTDVRRETAGAAGA